MRGKQFQKLEKSWDNHVSNNPGILTSSTGSKEYVYPIPEYMLNPDYVFDSKPAILGNNLGNVLGGSVAEDGREIMKLPIVPVSKSTAGFAAIAAALGFNHHEGTSEEKELDIIKCIMLRESIIMKLENLCNKIALCDALVQSSNDLESELLVTLSQMRSTTASYIECICTWRQSDINYEPHNLRTFYWEGQNYTMKVISDLDFLATQPLLVASLHFPVEKMIRNPLMLPNNLEEGDTWINPKERASFDSGGVEEGSFFEERLRVRKAERVLLQELELSLNDNYVNSMAEKRDSELNSNFSQKSHSIQNFNLNSNSNSKNSSSTLSGVSTNKDDNGPYIQNQNQNVNWKHDAQMQLKNLQKSKGEKTLSGSNSGNRTHELFSQNNGNGSKISHLEIYPESVKLTSFLSSYSSAMESKNR